MIVVIRPSDKLGRSFKGLHAYCAHDKENAKTSERVDWIKCHNIAVAPDGAWKVMAATAKIQNQLKQNTDIRTGRGPKNGPVLHVVMSFDEDEPQTQAEMHAAALDLLSKLGADPAKMRAKNKPKRRQFADEHEAVIYAHTDTKNTHLHLMINRIHPVTGVVLPTNNDHKKAQAWALDYSKRHSTDHKTPARQENKDMRNGGEYVKGQKRKTRNVFELEQRIKKASNDNIRLKAIQQKQSKQDAKLAEKSRNLEQSHAKQWKQLLDDHKARKASIARKLQSKINKAKTKIREEYRLKLRGLKTLQAAERVTFKGLETSFFGRAANSFKMAYAATKDIGGHRRGFNLKTFRSATDAAERKEYLDLTQQRARKAMESEKESKARQLAKVLKNAHAPSYDENRTYLTKVRQDLQRQQDLQNEELKQEWRSRNVQRKLAFNSVKDQPRNNKGFGVKSKLAHARKNYRTAFDKARQPPTAEQDNPRSGDSGETTQSAPPVSLKKSYAQSQRDKVKSSRKRRGRRKQDKPDR